MLSTAAKEDSSSEVSSPTTPSPPPPSPTTSPAAISASVAVDDKKASAGKKTTRQWEAWTHEEEESFFVGLRNVGKNFDKITSRVQSKNKDQVRHYYYRVIRRINKVLGPGFSLDAKNTKDANSAMLRWWSLLEKQSCSASKLHLKPRRFKTFVTALEHQLLKDRVKANKKKKVQQSLSVVVAPVSRKPNACCHEAAKAVAVEEFCSSKLVAGKNNSLKPRNPRRQEPLQLSKKRKKGSDSSISAAAIKRWEKEATAGVSLVAEAAEQVERAAAEQLGQAGPCGKASKPCTQASGQLHSGAFFLSGQDLRQEYAGEDGKLKLQLYPIDEATRKCMEQDGVNPFLQLTLKQRKPISSVIRHLVQKWAGSSAATGELLLFPFSTQAESMSNCKKWSIHDANINAGDVHSALGNPNLFRLRYCWVSPRMLHGSQAECLLDPVSPLVSEEGFQYDAGTGIGTVKLSAKARLLGSFLNTEIVSNLPEAVSKDFLCRTGSDLTRASGQNSEAAINDISPEESTKLRYNQSSSTAPVPVVAQDTETDVHLKRFELIESSSGQQGKLVDFLIQTDVKKGISLFGQSSADHPSNGANDLPDLVGQKMQENGGSLAACSWLYEGSNDSFVQRIWAIEDPSNASPLLPTEMDWADTLTNISVGEFLNEVSQTVHTASGVTSVQTLQPMQSLDSFDAAVAAQSLGISGSESNLVQHSETPVWDNEDTRDAFTFRKVVAQRGTSIPVQISLEPQSPTELLRESDGVATAFVDCGSLEAWRQSFDHAELPAAEELKYDPSLQLFPQHLECSGKGSSSQEFLWANVNKLHSSAHGSRNSCP